MKKVTLYTKNYCPYCSKAKALLKRKGVVDIKEIDITYDEMAQQELLAKSGGRKSVPQIFIGEFHVGGCDDLYALESAKKLDKLLAGN